MKILHTGDWHLGNILYNYDRIQEESDFLKQLKNIVKDEQPDCMIVAGDIYNVSAPGAYVQKIFTDAILDITGEKKDMTVVIIAGNHDSASRLEVDSMLWKRLNVFVIGAIEKIDENVNYEKHIIEVKDREENLKGYVIAVPYVYERNYPQEKEKEKQLNENCDKNIFRRKNFYKTLQEITKQKNKNNLPVVMTSHLAVSGSEVKSKSVHVQDFDFIDLKDFGDYYDYFALGHIHFPQTLQNSDKKARYCGSPLAVSFNEEYKHSVSVVNVFKDKTPEIKTVEIQDKYPLKTTDTQLRDIDGAIEFIKENKELYKNSYLRIAVKTEGYLPANAKQKAVDCCNEIGAKFCVFDIFQPENKEDENKTRIITAEQFKQLSVIEVAKKYMQIKNAELSQEFVQMLKQAENY